uniref:4-coumarate--CoA ligase 1-like isoform X3 n=1 Tax=Styela clava TaxID=7725 RepID=UPI001939A0D5|nr:4-coumarate--CoA ligase 1-like isoform X3 [Styela clava]
MSFRSQLPDVQLSENSLSEFIFHRIKDLGDKIALVDNSIDGKSLTFKQVYDQSRNCAGYLHKAGLGKGDVVGLCSPSSLEFPVAMLGVLACGGVVTPCNAAYSVGEILQQFQISKPKMVFVHEDCLNTMKEVQRKIDSLEKMFIIGESSEFVTMSEMIGDEYSEDFPKHIAINADEDLAILPYSSGTTGLPKSVMLSHKNLTSSFLIFRDFVPHETTDILYSDRPMYHSGGFWGLIVSLSTGRKLVLEKEFDTKTMLRAIEKYKITYIMTVPPILIELVNDDNTANYDVSSLKQVACGGAVLAPDISRKIAQKFDVDMRPEYGLTEFYFIAYHFGDESLFDGVGKIVPNTKVKIIDQLTGKELSENKTGEILAQGPQVMKGYMGNPDATARTITKDGWMHTGDIGYIDNDGILYIIDRLKEVIKYKSIQVSPAELESVILKHPKVMDVGVIGIPDTYAGELPKAFVVKKVDNLTKDDVDSFVKGELVDYKQLRGGIEFVQKIPKSATGKIQRNKLKKMAGII